MYLPTPTAQWYKHLLIYMRRKPALAHVPAPVLPNNVPVDEDPHFLTVQAARSVSSGSTLSAPSPPLLLLLPSRRPLSLPLQLLLLLLRCRARCL